MGGRCCARRDSGQTIDAVLPAQEMVERKVEDEAAAPVDGANNAPEGRLSMMHV